MRFLPVQSLFRDAFSENRCIYMPCLPSSLSSLRHGGEKLSGVSTSPVSEGQRRDVAHSPSSARQPTGNIQICICTGQSPTVSLSSFLHKHIHFLLCFNCLNENIKLQSRTFWCIINETRFPRLSRNLVLCPAVAAKCDCISSYVIVLPHRLLFVTPHKTFCHWPFDLIQLFPVKSCCFSLNRVLKLIYNALAA